MVNGNAKKDKSANIMYENIVGSHLRIIRYNISNKTHKLVSYTMSSVIVLEKLLKFMSKMAILSSEKNTQVVMGGDASCCECDPPNKQQDALLQQEAKYSLTVDKEKKVEFKSCEGHIALNEILQESKDKSSRIFVLFFGNETDGKSWCPDCVAAKPIIQKNYQYLKSGDLFVTVFVGKRDVWKDKTNVFRTDHNFKVTVIPTLLLYGTERRLVDPQCANPNLVKMFFEND